MELLLSKFFTQHTSEKAGFISQNGTADPTVNALEYDSRKVKPGALFFALRGVHTDGSLYIKDAVKNGAVVIVHENDIEQFQDNIVYIKVKDARFAMSPISASFYGFPSRRLLVTGVTGTEGKSTTVYLIWQLLRLMGKKAGFISTVQHCLGGEVFTNTEHQTTPEATVIQKMLREMADNNCEYAVLEASSHGLSAKTNRLGDVDFCAGVLTNITHEHLEFHGTWEQYRDDKANLFRIVNNYAHNDGVPFIEPFGVVNNDDKSSRYIMKLSNNSIFRYSPAGRDGDLILLTISSSAWGNWYLVTIPDTDEQFEIRDQLPGAYNSGNVLGATLTVAHLLNIPIREVVPHIKYLKPVRGRMTSVGGKQPFEIVVDYAHTPSSFHTIFPPLRARLDKTGGRIISLFGSAGERDTHKRAEQGKIAAHYSDFIILTDEDPRGERPRDILLEIESGVCKDQGLRIVKAVDHPDMIIDQNRAVFERDKNLFLIPDRPAAIRKALSLAHKGDLVLLLGKGHENSIIYKDRVMPFDEITETEKALAEMGF